MAGKRGEFCALSHLPEKKLQDVTHTLLIHALKGSEREKKKVADSIRRRRLGQTKVCLGERPLAGLDRPTLPWGRRG